MKRELLKFVIVGVINTLHYYILYVCLIELFGSNYLVSYVIATCSSMIGSYFLNTYFTYQVKPQWKSFLLFPLSQLANVFIQFLGLIILIDILQLHELLAPILLVFISIPITYFITRRIVHV